MCETSEEEEESFISRLSMASDSCFLSISSLLEPWSITGEIGGTEELTVSELADNKSIVVVEVVDVIVDVIVVITVVVIVVVIVEMSELEFPIDDVTPLGVISFDVSF